jgi:hypothetical protein
MEKTEQIKQYIKDLLEGLDGRGLILTDDEMIDEALEECGDFEVLKEIVTSK